MSETGIIIIVVLIAVFNVLAFALFGIDKKRAINREWRISEKTLFLSALPGSALGALLGMYFFRHKTKHWYFRIGIPALLILQLAAAGFIIWKLM